MKSILTIFRNTIIFLSLLIIGSCEEKPKPPIVATIVVSEITATSAKSGGTISSDSGAPITACGVCWGIGVAPTVSDKKTTDAIAAGSFISNIINLEGGTVYYVRAYATNIAGTVYGAAMSFTTLGQEPMVSGIEATNITNTSATLNGIAKANFLSTTVTFEYGTNTNYGNSINAVQSPVSGDKNTVVSARISGLTPGTTYHYRLKTTNSLGVTYSNGITFTSTITGITGTIRDSQGNIYQTIGIGNQMWMAENLKTTIYNDGTAIPNITNDSTWVSLAKGAYCDYANIPANSEIYGKLYNWYTVDNNSSTKIASNGGKNVCPAGWHVPSEEEWIAFENYLSANGYNYDGSTTGNKYAKSLAASTNWRSSLFEGVPGSSDYPVYQNKTGFTALPGGNRNDDGVFYLIGLNGYWWSSTESSLLIARHRYICYHCIGVSSVSSNKYFGFSVRCIKDN